MELPRFSPRRREEPGGSPTGGSGGRLPRFRLWRGAPAAAGGAGDEAWQAVIGDLQRPLFKEEDEGDAAACFEHFEDLGAYKVARARARRLSLLRSSLAGLLSAVRELGEDGGGAEAVGTLREALRHSASVVEASQELLEAAIQVAPKVPRKGYLQALTEVIPRPPEEKVLNWRQSVPRLFVESHRGEQRFALLDDEAIQQRLESVGLLPLQKWVRETSEDLLLELVQAGLTFEHAERYVALAGNAGQIAMAKALEERSSRHAACMHALVDVLAHRAHEQEQARLDEEDGGELPPRLYASLALLRRLDKAWNTVDTVDSTGFHGVLTNAVVQAMDASACLSPQGLYILVNGTQRKELEGDVVCFESAPPDMSGCHEAIMMGAQRGVFMPNTLFRVKSISEAPFEAEGITVRQRLITVTATYKLAVRRSAGGDDAKMCCRPVTLQYSSRGSYVRGWDDITAKPMLTMEQEFDRDTSWFDWKGVRYTLRETWGYVIGPAVRKEDCTPGVRDDKNHGKTPEQFREQANELIRTRRGDGLGTDVPEGQAYLTLDEVLAIRLYSGPAYQPLNGFLREIAQTSGVYRTALARDPGLTFTATVGHLCNAIRKLAAIASPEELRRKLYRGVRGTLAREFWLPDEQGMVCATDVAFMSTSQTRATPIHYMGGGPNVLWELQVRPQTDDGYHRGADIAMLSQFAAEAEVLFPPMTMLEVVRTPGGRTALGAMAAAVGGGGGCGVDRRATHRSSLARAAAGFKVAERLEDNKSFVTIEVQPNFV